MYNSVFISREELNKVLEVFPNEFDKAYYYLLYEGFRPEAAFEVRTSDIQGNRISRRNGAAVSVSEECRRCLEAAGRQEVYYRFQNTAEKLTEWPLNPAPFVIRFPDTGTGVRMPGYDEKHSRMKVKLMHLKRDGRIPEKFTEKQVWKSGLAEALRLFIERAGGDVDLAGKQYKTEFDQAAARWGRPFWESKQICKAYLL